MRRLPGSILAALWLAASLAAADLSPQRYLEHVKVLAGPEMKGRGTGTPELEKAAAYIARQFRALGLETAGVPGYLQPFPVTTNARLGAGNRLAFGDTQLKAEEDFLPFNMSESGSFSGPVVFAGYGITAREYHYDDYAGVNVNDKIALVLRHEPQESDDKSVFAGRVLTEHAQFSSKAVNAKMHGARGLIIVNDMGAHPGESDTLEKFARTAGPANAGVFVLQLKAEVADRWLAPSGKNLKDLQADIDKDLQPRSFALPESLVINLTVDVKRDIRTVHNVTGYLRGETGEYVVVGAHYDHVGLGEQFSMAPSQAGTPHPGADDNASGTAGVLELARYFASRPKPRRGILFLAFAGEELGLLGSSHYVNHPSLPIDKAVAMVNLDMIGRIREGRVYVGGLGTGTTFKPMLEELVAESELKVDFSDQTGYGSSDHTSFTTKQVPVLFFFSGLHGDYHRPSDTWDKIDAEAATRLLKLVAGTVERISGAAGRPQFVRLADPRPPRGAMGGGAGVYFGSVPDFAETPGGFRFADVREGSPAAQAGLKGGDVLFEFDGKPVQNLYDFTYALRSRKPGEEVLVKVRRGERVVEAKVKLGQRK